MRWTFPLDIRCTGSALLLDNCATRGPRGLPTKKGKGKGKENDAKRQRQTKDEGKPGKKRQTTVTQGAVEKKRTKATYICRSAKKKVVTTLFYFYFYFYFLSIFFEGVFWAFRNNRQ
jgi:hypothetical protein